MSRPGPRRSQNHPPLPQSSTGVNSLSEQDNQPPAHAHAHAHSHAHSHGHDHHARTRSRQRQGDAPRRQRQPPPASDGESDAYMAQPSVPPALAGRTNTELNLGVLRRYLPSITAVLSIAASAVVYTLQPPSEWKRSNLEGTMFICSQRKAPADAAESGCLFILSRKGLQNLVLDLDTVAEFERADDLLIFKLDYAAHEVHLETGEAVEPLVLGLWTYAEDESDRQTNAALINDMWSQALSTRDARARAARSAPGAPAETGPAALATGRRVSVTDLFSAYNGNVIPAPAP
ncbi:PH domain-like protein [Xylaria palmicola]|nr:PH domain-like protein [Xylaria palmicola]